MVGASPQIDQLTQTTKQTRRRRNFPSTKFEDVLPIAKTIQEEAIDGQLRRLTLFDRLGRSPNSGPSRQLVISSGKYGLTVGGSKAEYLSLTEEGGNLANNLPSLSSCRELAFKLAIGKFDPFAQMYEKLRNQRLPAEDVLQDQFGQLGVDLDDCEKAAQIFEANARFVGIISPVSGSDHIIPIEQLLEDSTVDTEQASPEQQETVTQESTLPESEQSGPASALKPTTTVPSQAPSIHVNVQIHIDSSADPGQIDQIFESMARHLYGRES